MGHSSVESRTFSGGGADGPSDALTHVDGEGTARMVDVGEKPVTRREATARALVRVSETTAARIAAADLPKGDVITVARLAGVMAAKQTGALIPLAHPLPLDVVDVDIAVSRDHVTVTATVATHARTGVEMEAMCAAATTALTVYDMVKGVERGVVIERVELLAKSGGRHDWSREEDEGR